MNVEKKNMMNITYEVLMFILTLLAILLSFIIFCNRQINFGKEDYGPTINLTSKKLRKLNNPFTLSLASNLSDCYFGTTKIDVSVVFGDLKGINFIALWQISKEDTKYVFDNLQHLLQEDFNFDLVTQSSFHKYIQKKINEEKLSWTEKLRCSNYSLIKAEENQNNIKTYYPLVVMCWIEPIELYPLQEIIKIMSVFHISWEEPSESKIQYQFIGLRNGDIIPYEIFYGDEKLSVCSVCLENESTILLQPCKHLCCCAECFEHIDTGSNVGMAGKCPVCRNPIGSHNVIKVNEDERKDCKK
ncbi:hypothetical protein SNEBB_004527 [Seison nebaliae]|nr:hypothetical protein SNEBB_004527 [Seison nebaliae]